MAESIIGKDLKTRFGESFQKAFNDYTQAYLGPEGAVTLPTKTEYDIAVNRAAAKVPSQTLEGTFPGMTGKVLGTVSDIAMPAFAFGASPFYDMYQASDRARAQFGDPDVRSVVDDAEIPIGPSLPEYAKAVADENILSSMIGRTAGAGQNLVNRFSRIKDGVASIMPESFFSKAYAPEPTERERQSIEMGIRNPELLNKFDRSPASSGVRQTIGSRIMEGLGSMRDTITDKLGSVGDFIKSGGVLGNVIKAFGPRGDESTRGIAGLNVNDVFNIDSFGTEENPTKDPYGINIVSAFGNYNEYVKNLAEKHKQMQFKTKSGKQRQKFYADAAAKIRAEERRKEEIAQRAFLASQNRGGDGPQNNPQGGLGRQDYSRAATADFASLADEMGIDYR